MLLRALHSLIEVISDRDVTFTHSQEGEDMILRRLFNKKNCGFYVDVGAHHPRRYSNTYYFYRKGWSGINIEPNPETLALFHKYRPRDINIECGVSDQEGLSTYFMFNEPALNSFDENLATDRERNTSYQIVTTKKIQVQRLDHILEDKLPPGVEIDFINIDTEGHDLRVVMSNDWQRFRAKIVLVEVLNSSIDEVRASPQHQYLTERGYVMFAKTFNTVIYSDTKR